MSDSAGVPWAGRHFEPNDSADDDGSAPEGLVEAIRRFRAGEGGEAEVVDALRVSRLLIPLVTELGAAGRDDGGSDKSHELSVAIVAGPDGRTVFPAFSSVAAMAAWDPRARPVPVAGPRVALAAVAEGTEVVVLDATSDTEFGIRRPALWAISQTKPWTPSYLDPEVLSAFRDAAAAESAVRAVQLAPGDPAARLAGPELIVRLSLAPGLDRDALDSLMARLQGRWMLDPVIAERVDSLRVQLLSEV